MSERSIRERIGAVITATTGAANVYTEAVRIDSEAAAVEHLAEGVDAEGRHLILGWVVLPGSSKRRVATAMGGFHEVNYTYQVAGYRSRGVDGQEELAEADADAVAEALVSLDALLPLTPRAYAEDVAPEVGPATLAGLPVWETRITLTVTEYPAP